MGGELVDEEARHRYRPTSRPGLRRPRYQVAVDLGQRLFDPDRAAQKIDVTRLEGCQFPESQARVPGREDEAAIVWPGSVREPADLAGGQEPHLRRRQRRQQGVCARRRDDDPLPCGLRERVGEKAMALADGVRAETPPGQRGYPVLHCFGGDVPQFDVPECGEDVAAHEHRIAGFGGGPPGPDRLDSSGPHCERDAGTVGVDPFPAVLGRFDDVEPLLRVDLASERLRPLPAVRAPIPGAPHHLSRPCGALLNVTHLSNAL